MTTIDFFYDIVCPYAYLASTQIEKMAERCGARVRWVPTLLGGIYRSIQAPQIPATSWPVAKQRIGARDLQRQAKLREAPLNFPIGHPRRTVEAMRLLCSAPDEKVPTLTAALYKAYWVDGEDVSSKDVLNGIARRHGIADNSFQKAEAREMLYRNTTEAVERGAFGVPSFFVGEQMWWGQDRMHFVEARLRSVDRSWLGTHS